MSTSVIEICNNALQGLKANRILSLADGSEEANLCNQVWPSVRDAVLASHPWNCAMKLDTLAASATAPAWKWDYAYPLPADCLRVFEVYDSNDKAVEDFELSGREILCDADAPLSISYIRREEDPTKYDPLLCEALTAALMARIAFPLTASITAKQYADQLYKDALREARGVDAMQGGRAKSLGPNSWTLAKYGTRGL